jgi:hypothetical protein
MHIQARGSSNKPRIERFKQRCLMTGSSARLRTPLMTGSRSEMRKLLRANYSINGYAVTSRR